jgi:hypothetical protein
MLYLPVGTLWLDGIYSAKKVNEIAFSRMMNLAIPVSIGP